MKISPTDSTIDSLLTEAGLLEEVEAVGLKRILTLQLEEAILERGTTKSALARAMGTSRSQLDRLRLPGDDYKSGARPGQTPATALIARPPRGTAPVN